MNNLQLLAVHKPLARAGQIGLQHFRVLKHSPYHASVGLSLNR
jgi:hypothetical protein